MAYLGTLFVSSLPNLAIIAVAQYIQIYIYKYIYKYTIPIRQSYHPPRNNPMRRIALCLSWCSSTSRPVDNTSLQSLEQNNGEKGHHSCETMWHNTRFPNYTFLTRAYIQNLYSLAGGGGGGEYAPVKKQYGNPPPPPPTKKTKNTRRFTPLFPHLIKINHDNKSSLRSGQVRPFQWWLNPYSEHGCYSRM